LNDLDEKTGIGRDIHTKSSLKGSIAMEWKLLTKEDYVTTTWSGGTTTQLAIAPEGAVYADRDFLWRLSSAGVELEAHCRAQNVLNEADGQARELRRGMEQWLGRVQLEYYNNEDLEALLSLLNTLHGEEGNDL